TKGETLQKHSQRSIASLLFCKASVLRTKKSYSAAFDILRSASAASPNHPATSAGYSFEVGRIFYSQGYDLTAIAWLEKAEQAALSSGETGIYLDTLRYLSTTWTAKAYYAKALQYAEKLVDISSKLNFSHRHRIGLLELASVLELTGQTHRARTMYLAGLNYSIKAKANYHSGQFLSALLLRSLFENDVHSAKAYLAHLTSIDIKKQFTFEQNLANAMIANTAGNRLLSEEYFSKLDIENNTSEFIVPYWRATIAERDSDWNGLLTHADNLRRLSEANNFLDDLPGIYSKLALGNFRAGDGRTARTFAHKALSIIERFRSTTRSNLSISLMDVYHSVYRLLIEIEQSGGNADLSFKYSEALKAGVLRSRIDLSVLRPLPDPPQTLREQLMALSEKRIAGTDTSNDIAALESKFVEDLSSIAVEPHNEPRPHVILPDDTAVVSYIFVPSGKLHAFVWESRKPLRIVTLAITDEQVKALAAETQNKIKNRIFFKADGRRIYENLLAPLELTSKRIVIVPDKLLWKIPFHALSPDGNRYLIETNLVSYSPSVELLGKYLSREEPKRRTIQIFASDTYNNFRLAHVNGEASQIASMFAVSPHLQASRNDFFRSAANSDILHFSMHAQTDGEDPLSSFLAFQKGENDPGRLTVNDLLTVRLKPNNLAFLASCDTSKVHNGEGVISIPWALLGSGSSAVISSQWEATDKSTKLFATAFYAELLKGQSTSVALQKSAISMINNKESGYHEPYYWAAFNLLGDFR
ncbi:MAG: CHAT domain-containing protein, partial [Pyrinomonadaceae bacterium]